jgi:hypothetical protein
MSLSTDAAAMTAAIQSLAIAQTSLANELAREDDRIAAHADKRRFSYGNRPVIRWIKGDGLDDQITRAAIGQATRLFGDRVDYCLCTNQIGVERVRSILKWAKQPVEWWPLVPSDNPELAAILDAASCPVDQYGYWWKWFPERVREEASEWIVNGNMVIAKTPPWLESWEQGTDCCRVTQDDRGPPENLYGPYSDLVDERRLYSGLVSLLPRQHYLHQFRAVLTRKPLRPAHDGRQSVYEQGVVAAAFQRFEAVPIALCELPICRISEKSIDYGLYGNQGRGWGYHFKDADRCNSPHFMNLMNDGVIFSRPDEPSVIERFAWMGGSVQWGVPGWSMPDACVSIIVNSAKAFAGCQVLELGTSRGRLTAILNALGCNVTTIDKHDRGATRNLEGLNVRVVIDEALNFLETTPDSFDLIVVDFHGNSVAHWRRLAPLLKRCLSRGGMLLLNNASLWKMPEWHEEIGVRWFLDTLRPPWKYEVHDGTLPGVAVVTS